MSITIPEGYKASSLGIIPIDWEVRKLGNEIESLASGISVNSVDGEIVPGDLCVLKTSAVLDGCFYPAECKKINFEDHKRAKLNPLKNSIVISRMNTPELVGECGYVDMTYSNLFLPDRLWQTKFFKHSIVDAKWLNYLLNSVEYKLKIKSTATGTSNSMKNISKDSFLSIEILIPPGLEQQYIAERLSNIDEVIQKTLEIVSKKELQKKALMQQLLTGKKRLKGFNDKWQETRLGNVFDRITRKNTENNTNVVTISAQRGFVKQEDFFNKIVASDVLDNYFLVECGEFCYNKSYSNGYPWGATKRLNDFDKAVVTTLYICFKLSDNTKFSSDFFEQYFESGALEEGLMKIAHEGGRAHGLLNVTPADFLNLKIVIPGGEEQATIAKLLLIADKEIKLLRAKADKLKEQKKGMMQLLLTGKKRLKIPMK